MKIKLTLLAILFALLCGVASASSYAVDDFDDGVLDSKWGLLYDSTDANNVTWVEDAASSSISVTEMEVLKPAFIEPKWTNFTLSHLMVVDPYNTGLGLDDFHIDFKQSYGLDPNFPETKTYFKLYLRSGVSGYLMSAGYEDKSDTAAGYPHFWSLDDYGQNVFGYGLTEDSGVNDWDIIRTNGVIDVYLNDVWFASAETGGNLTEIRIMWQARYLDGYSTSTPAWAWGQGNPDLSLDYIRVLPRSPQREISWTGASSAVWATGSNWSDSTAPDTDTVVTIDDTSNDPVIEAGSTVNLLYLDVDSGSLVLEGGLEAFSLEVADGASLEFANENATITLFGNQRNAMAVAMGNGLIFTNLVDRFLASEYDSVNNKTIVRVIVPVIAKVLEWNFNENSGVTVPDGSGTGNAGTLTSIDGAMLPTWAVDAGRSGQVGDNAISFAGNPNSFVELLNGVDLPIGGGDAWTMNIWVYTNGLPTGSGDGVMIAGMGRIAEAGIDSGVLRTLRDTKSEDPDVGIGFYGNNSSYYTQEPWSIGQWQMITMTCDYMLNLKIYKNGYLVAEATPDLTDAEPIVRIGKGVESGFTGLIDDMAIWTYPMSQKDIVTDLWGSWICGETNDNQPLWDLNADCEVDFADFAIVAEGWLAQYGVIDLEDLANTWLNDGKITGNEL